MLDAALDAALSQPLPVLSRDARLRITQAEKDGKERYERDTEPDFPTNPGFSFLAADLYRSKSRILERVRIYAEEILDAHLQEYLERCPAELATNMGLRVQLADAILKLTNELWCGYRAAVWIEPMARRARYAGARAGGIQREQPELETWRYPEGQAWADFWRQARRPGSPMALLDTRYDATIQQTILDRVNHFENEAKARLAVTRQAEATSSIVDDESLRVSTASPTAPAMTEQHPGSAPDHRSKVDDFLALCNREFDFEATRKHIWLARGHRTSRQFQYWQANNAKATKKDHRNFSAILTMKPAEFLALLKERRIVESSLEVCPSAPAERTGALE